MNVLVIYSNPPGTDRLRLDKEDRVFFKLSKAFPQVTIDRLHASEVEDIHDAINVKPYDIIQFSGHSSRLGMYLCRDDIEEGEVVSPQRLSSLLQLAVRDPSVVIFLSCYSHALQAALSPLAPFVITTRDDIPDAACIAFVKGFYNLFFENRQVNASFNYAKKYLRSFGHADDSFVLSRRQIIEQRGSVFLESQPRSSQRQHSYKYRRCCL